MTEYLGTPLYIIVLYQSIILPYFNVTTIAVMPPGDCSVLTNFRRKTHCRKSLAKPDVK